MPGPDLERDVYPFDGGWACRFCEWVVEDDSLTEQQAQDAHDAWRQAGG